MDFKQLVMNEVDSKYQKMANGTTENPLSKTLEVASDSTYARNREKYYNRLEREEAEFNKAIKQINDARKERLKREEKEEQEKERKRRAHNEFMKKVLIACAVGAVALFLIVGVIWPKMIRPKMDADSLYTPEIVRGYNGTYYVPGGTKGEAMITISSCDESGIVKGYFEFFADDSYGKYTFSGEITSKKNNGDTVFTINPGQWVIQPKDFNMLDAMEVEITDDYKSLQCSFYSMDWVAGENVDWVPGGNADFASGENTNEATEENNEFAITTADDFKKLAGSSSTYEIKNDIDLGGVTWTPVEGFTGVLEGNGYTISNLTIESSSSTVGFFSTLEGVVQNVKFDSAQVTVSGRNENIGILCGELKGRINNVSVSGTVNADKSTNVGGVVGYVSTKGTYTLTSVSNSADVSGLTYVGGVFGKVNDSLSNGTDYYDLVLVDIHNFGNVNATEDFAGGITAYINAEAKGFGGKITTTIQDCSNNGKVSGNYYVGGIVGQAWGYSTGLERNVSIIDGCTNKAEICAKAYVGCIAGETDEYKIINCSNEGSTLNASGYFISEGKKYAYVGGIVGKGTCLENCTNYIDITYNGGGAFVGGLMGYCDLGPAITGISLASDTAGAYFKNLTNMGSVTGNSYVGGVIGGTMYYWSNGNRAVTATFEKMVNSGTVVASDEFAGGIAGYVAGGVGGFRGRLSWCFYDCVNEASISGTTKVGGLFGGFKNGEVNGSAYAENEVTIDGCSSTGKVSGNSNCNDIIGFDDIKK